MSPNSARKTIADIFVHPIQVGNTAMESILTMVGYMYTAVPSCLRDSYMFRRSSSISSRIFRKATNRKKSLISQSGKHSTLNRNTDRKENGQCLSRTGALSPNSLRQSSKTDTICCKFVIFTLMNRNLTNCIMETWKIITNVVIVDYIKHKNDESISAENLKQLRKSHFIFAMLVAIGLLYSHICRFFI